MCLFVCLLFIGHTTFVHFAALPPSPREQEPPSRAAPRERASMHLREHARGPGAPATAPALGVLGGSAAKWTNVVWPIKRRQTNQQTNKHTLLFYRYRFYDWTTSIYSYFHDNISKRCLPQPAKHYIQYSLLACHINMILASLPASCFGPLSED